jgi:hypothetical protein
MKTIVSMLIALSLIAAIAAPATAGGAPGHTGFWDF